MTLFDDTVAQAVLANGVVDIATSCFDSYSVTVQAPPGALDNEPGREEHHRRVIAPRNELVSLAFESNIPGQLVFAMTWSGHHHQSYAGLVVPCGGPLADPPLYSPRFNDEIYAGLKYAILWATDGGRLFASNTTSAGGTYAGVLAFGEEVSFQAVPWPGYKFVRLEFYEGGDKYPYMTSNDALTNHWCWARSKYTVAKAVFAPKDECKLDLETKVTPTGTPGDDCPGYVVVEDAKTIGSISYHGPKRYYPKGGWVRLRPVANPGYRFVKWQTAEDVTGAVLFFGIPFMETGINEIAEERIAVRMDDDTTITAVFKWDPVIEMITPAGDPVNKAMQSGDGQNEFTYSTASPGILTMNLKARVTPSCVADLIKDQCRFTVDPIAGSTLDWDTANPGGKPTVSGDELLATVRFTGLPANNTAFGGKKAAIYFNASKKDEENYEVFFPRDATNHPANSPNANWPNWMFYWLQTVRPLGSPAPTFKYGAANQFTPGTTEITLCDSVKNPYRVPYGTHNPLEGIDHFAWTVIHESQHYKDWLDLWSNDYTDWRNNHRGRTGPGDDKDADRIPNSVEDANLNGNYDAGDLYDWENPNTPTAGRPANITNDFEDWNCQRHAGVTGDHARDWGDPGMQHKTKDIYND